MRITRKAWWRGSTCAETCISGFWRVDLFRLFRWRYWPRDSGSKWRNWAKKKKHWRNSITSAFELITRSGHRARVKWKGEARHFFFRIRAPLISGARREKKIIKKKNREKFKRGGDFFLPISHRTCGIHHSGEKYKRKNFNECRVLQHFTLDCFLLSNSFTLITLRKYYVNCAWLLRKNSRKGES